MNPKDVNNMQHVESQLCAQIHHSSSHNDYNLQSRSHNLNDPFVSKNMANRQRYWIRNSFPGSSRNIGAEITITTTSANTPRPYSSCIGNSEPKNNENKRFSNKNKLNNGNGNGNKKNRKAFQLSNIQNMKNNQANSRKCGNMYFQRKFSKYQRSVEYKMKKAKADSIKQETQIKSPIINEVIVVDSSEENDDNDKDDDVIEVKMPSPPMLTINSSDENESEETTDESMQSNSRCPSRSSISDDFIENADRSRLVNDDENTTENDELSFLQENPNLTREEDSTICKELDMSNRVDDSNLFVSPKRKAVRCTVDYQVTQQNFRALDVYESESSDMPESVYGKGRTKGPSRTSSSDVEEIDKCTERTKKLRRRRTFSNRGSEPNEDSTDTEEEVGEETALPFISRGEAVENCKAKLRQKKNSKSLGKDYDEFINKLKSIAQGNESDGNETDVSNKSDEEVDISARKIAEEVIGRKITKNQKNQCQNEEEGSIQDSSENLLTEQSSIDLEEAIPEVCSAEASEVLEFIDKMDMNNDNEKNEITEEFSFQITEGNVGSEEFDEEGINEIEDTEESRNAVVDHDFLKTVYSHNNQIGWNDEMIRFYERSWGGEDFSVSRIRNSMNKNDVWNISFADKYFRTKKSKIKCFNCCEMGHFQTDCPNPKREKICYMCGEVGHREPRCPNTICLKCGSKTDYFVKSCNACRRQFQQTCPVCNIPGHSIDYCPDKWRRYHSTTIPNDNPNDNIQYAARKYCCICAKRGHLPEHCYDKFQMEYSSVRSEIMSFAKSYMDINVENSLNSNVIGYQLFYEPNEMVNFKFSSGATMQKRQYYWRFLKSVDLTNILSRKRELNIETNMNSEEPNEKKCKEALNINKQISEDIAKNVTKTGNSQNVCNKLRFRKTGGSLLKKVLKNNFQKDKSPKKMKVGNEAEVSIRPEKYTSNVKIIEGNMEITEEFIKDDSVESRCDEMSCSELEKEENINEEIKLCDDEQEAEVQDEIMNTCLKDNRCLPLSDTEEENTGALNSDICWNENVTVQSETENEEDENEVLIVEGCDADSEKEETVELPLPPPEDFLSTLITQEPNEEVLQLPDFIPLSSNDDSDLTNIVEGTGISYRITAKNMNKEKKHVYESDLPSSAKICLTNYHSKFFLSSIGQRILFEISKKYDLKVNINLTKYGNILVLHGIPENQKKFHMDLQSIFKNVTEGSLSENEKIENVPRKRLVAIKFIQQELLKLKRDWGDIYKVYQKASDPTIAPSATVLKSIRKARRTLNMILVGQAGFGDGKEHLQKLIELLNILIESKYEYIPDEIRQEIYETWRNIFSPRLHNDNYVWFKKYLQLKGQNKLPQVELDWKALSNPQSPCSIKFLKSTLEDLNVNSEKTLESESHCKVVGLDVVFNPFCLISGKISGEQEISNEIEEKNDGQNCSKSQNQSNALCYNGNINNPIQSLTSRKQIQNQKSVQFDPENNSNQESKSFVSKRIVEVKKVWENQCENLLNKIDCDKSSNRNHIQKADESSVFWSRECIKCIDLCLAIENLNPQIKMKLARASDMANQGKLSHTACVMMSKVYNVIKGNIIN